MSRIRPVAVVASSSRTKPLAVRGCSFMAIAISAGIDEARDLSSANSTPWGERRRLTAKALSAPSWRARSTASSRLSLGLAATAIANSSTARPSPAAACSPRSVKEQSRLGTVTVVSPMYAEPASVATSSQKRSSGIVTKWNEVCRSTGKATPGLTHVLECVTNVLARCVQPSRPSRSPARPTASGGTRRSTSDTGRTQPFGYSHRANGVPLSRTTGIGRVVEKAHQFRRQPVGGQGLDGHRPRRS